MECQPGFYQPGRSPLRVLLQKTGGLCAKRVDFPPHLKLGVCSGRIRSIQMASLPGRNHHRTQLRQCKYLINIIEQDHRFIKRRVNPGLGFFSFNTARRTISGYETVNIIRKGQIEGVGKGDIRGQVRFVSSLFCIAV